MLAHDSTYEAVISDSDNTAIMDFYVDFCDAIISLDRSGWMIEEPGHIERFDSFTDMMEGIRYTLTQWENENIIRIERKPDGITITSLID